MPLPTLTPNVSRNLALFKPLAQASQRQYNADGYAESFDEVSFSGSRGLSGASGLVHFGNTTPPQPRQQLIPTPKPKKRRKPENTSKPD